MINLKKFTDFLIKFEIDPNQFYFMLCLMNDDVETLTRYFNNFPLFSKQKLEELHTKGYIIIINPIDIDTDIKLSDIIVNESFKESFFIDPEIAAKELRDCYFDVLVADGKKYPAKNIALYELTKLYSPMINGDILKHQEIIEKTKKLVSSQEHADLGLKKYVETEYWTIINTNSKSMGNDTVF